jgi:hypothetical protein
MAQDPKNIHFTVLTLTGGLIEQNFTLRNWPNCLTQKTGVETYRAKLI